MSTKLKAAENYVAFDVTNIGEVNEGFESETIQPNQPPDVQNHEGKSIFIHHE